MEEKPTCLIVLFIILTAVLGISIDVQKVEASGTIYIAATGEVVGTDKIERLGDSYVFADNISDCINIERDNIILDGRGFTLEGAIATYFSGIYLRGRHNVTVKNLTIKRFRYGVIVSSSSNISILANNITIGRSISYQTGVYLLNSSENNVFQNRFSNNTRGVFLASSSENNIFRNEVADNENGISFEHSSNNKVLENNIRNNTGGIMIEFTSHNNSIQRNNVAANELGIILSYGSSMNIISQNNITKNKNYGMFILGSLNNSIHHNSFVENTEQVNATALGYTNSWNDDLEGNYWSDYTGIDLDHDGIGDSEHIINANNTDKYPLMGVFHSLNTPLGHYVNIISNSTIEYFTYFNTNSTIKMYVSNMTANQTAGFCRITIPHKLMDVSNIKVIIDNESTEVLHFNDTIYDNSTHRWIYFAHQHSIHKIDIIPEFPSTLILPFFIIATLLTIIIYKREHLK